MCCSGVKTQAPAVNTALSLKQRCEIALSGVIIQDLWALLATETERKKRMPKGMCQMAPQTRSNLQLVAMCVANICATKEDTWHPFQFGHALSEIHIEHMFGRYRGQYAHSDLNARAYWNANARVARQQAAKSARLKTTAPALDKEPALSPATFLGSGSCGSLRECVQNALSSALLLAAKCADTSVHELEKVYRKQAFSIWDDDDNNVPDLDTTEAAEAEECLTKDAAARRQEAQNVLKEIQEMAEEEYTEEPVEAPEDVSKDPDAEIPDGPELIDLTTCEGDSEENRDFPQTLREALVSEQSMWTRLWQLTMKLRCGKHGIDCYYLRKSGSIIVLNLGDDAEPSPAAVLTVWSCQKKPRPCAHPVPLKNVFCFRAVLLEAFDDDRFGASQNVSKYFPDQVVGLLDAEDGSIAKMSLTQASIDALMKLKNVPQPAVAALAQRCGRGRGKKKSSRAISFARVSRRLRKRQVQKDPKDQKDDEEAPAEKDEEQTGGGFAGSGPDPDADLSFHPTDFRRSNKGRKAMSTVMQRLIDLDRAVFPQHPLFDPESNLCTVKGMETFKAQQVAAHAPLVWQGEFFKVRNPDEFGRRALRLEARETAALVAPQPATEAAPGAAARVPVVYNAICKVAPVKEDFVGWYRRAVSQLVEESDLKGVPIIRPWGMFMWDEVVRSLQRSLRELGAQSFALPVAQHAADTNANEQTVPNVPREAAEPLLYKVLSKWISSSRDLPLILCRDTTATAPNVKRPLPLMRGRELRMHEGHAVHCSEEETTTFLEKVLAVYLCLCRDLFCLNAVVHSDGDGRQSIRVRTRGGDAIEVAFVKQVEKKVAEDFKVTYCAPNAETGGAENYACSLSHFSCTIRLLGATLAQHGDHLGPLWPCRVAPEQVVIIPMSRFQDRSKDDAAQRSLQRLLRWCQEAVKDFESSSIRVKSDLEDETPGKRIRHWIGCGVPLLLTVQLAEGPEDGVPLANVRMTARDMPGLEVASLASCTGQAAALEAAKQLEEMHQRLLKRGMEEGVDAEGPKKFRQRWGLLDCGGVSSWH
eukprot:s486_g12.t1